MRDVREGRDNAWRGSGTKDGRYHRVGLDTHRCVDSEWRESWWAARRMDSVQYEGGR
jgi:hypothetical protein